MANKARMRTYHAIPETATADTPSIVLMMHLTGVDKDMRDAADAFAREGFAVIVPDLYADFDAPDGDVETSYATFIPFAKQLLLENVEPKVLDAAKWLRERFPRTRAAIAGYCMGGRMAMVRCAGHSDVFYAGAIWYGLVPDMDPRTIDIPIVASFGAEDHSIPKEQAEALRDGLTVKNDFKIYEGAGHAFCSSRPEHHNAAAAADSFRRAVEFLKATLSS